MKTDKKRRKPGFTLIELMVVVMIMALLGMIVLGIGGYASRKAAEGRAKADLENLRTALDEYRLDRGRYIGYPDDVGDEREVTEGEFEDLTNYVSEIRFRDPWERPYRYHLQSRFMYRVWSTGPRGPDEEYDNIE